MFASVTLNHPISNQYPFFTYEIPEKIIADIKVGQKVKVPLKNKFLTGIIIKISEKKPKYPTKTIEKIISARPFLSEYQIKTCYWISKYYFSSLYKAIKLFLPRPLFTAKIKVDREIWLHLAKTKIDLNVPEFKKAKRQAALIKYLLQNKKTEQKKVIENKICSLSTIKALLGKRLIKITEGKILIPFKKQHVPICHNLLTLKQKKIVDQITKSKEKTFLLHGITGSGKTEIYLQCIKKIMDNAIANEIPPQFCVLVPEISLTPQLVEYFHKTFGKKIAVWHSRLSKQEKIQTWMRIYENEAQVIIGSRSALFLPFQDLKMIIIDEEHEWTYKQENEPRYHTREVALKIAEFTGLKVVLGSATPSVESYFDALKNKYKLLEIHERVSKNGQPELPHTEIVDMRDEIKKRNFSIFSEALQENLKRIIEKKEQALLFINRRGLASAVVCRECGYIEKCLRCNVALKYHKNKTAILICHHCNYVRIPPVVCPNCKSHYIKLCGIGTQRVEEEIHKLFPEIKTIRMDKDTTSKKESFEEFYKKFKEENMQILIGTQMVGKGLDFPKINLVGVILADLSLHFPDFRSLERTFQLITQVAGRAGRQNKGKVIIQTYSPENIAIKTAANHDYRNFYEEEIKNRRELKNPPFSKIIKLTYVHPDEKKVYLEVKKMVSQIKYTIPQKSSIKVTFAPALIPTLYGKHHWNIILKGKNLSTTLEKIKIGRGWRIDIDPVNVT